MLRLQLKKAIFTKKQVEDERLFPFTSVNARVMWHNALNKTGNGQVDPRTKRMLMSPHVLRKFFRGMLGQQSVDVAECLMGHHGYLTEAYRKYPNPEKTLAEFYKQNEHLLWIFTEAEEITKLKKELDERFETLQALNEKLQLENLDLRRHLQEQTERIKVLEELAHEAKGIFDFLEKQGIVPQSFTEKEGG